MAAASTHPQENDPGSVSFHEIERELSHQVQAGLQSGEAPALRARMSNLVIFCDCSERADSAAAVVPDIVVVHPARVVLLVGEPGPDTGALTASVNAWCRRTGGLKICSEQVTVRAQGASVDRLPYAVRSLLIGDLPTNLWWAAPQPASLAGPLLYELAEHAQQVIYDSCGWTEPARGVAATAAWLAKFERGPGQGRWRVASDLNWRRLKHWRRLLAQALDPAAAPGALEHVTEVLVEHGPHAVVQAWELASWLALRLGWRVQTGRVQPGVELTWQFAASHGPVTLRIRRLSDGPSDVRRLRIAWTQHGPAAALVLVAESDSRLAVLPEGFAAAPRTMIVQPQPLAELVARQLSDRDRDPVFRESMGVAEVLAQSVLGG